MTTKFSLGEQAQCDAKYKINGLELPFITRKKQSELYPTGGFQVLGDLRKQNNKQPLGQLTFGDQQLPIMAYSGDITKNELVLGYLPLAQPDCYLRIVKKRRGKLLAILALIALLLTIFFGGLWLGQKNNPVDTPVKIKAGSMTNPNPENIRLPGIEKVYAKAGKTRVNQPLLNVEGNAVKLTYSIILSETGEEIYKSPAIEPGYGIKQFDMNRTFKKGSYPISILVKASKLKETKKDNKVAYNAGQLNATLVVE